MDVKFWTHTRRNTEEHGGTRRTHTRTVVLDDLITVIYIRACTVLCIIAQYNTTQYNRHTVQTGVKSPEVAQD